MTSIARSRGSRGIAMTLGVRAAAPYMRRIAGSATRAFHAREVVTSWAIAAAALAPMLISAGWVVAGALQPPSYNPVRQSVSVLAGHGAHDRWLMTAAIFLAACCYLVTAAGLHTAPFRARLLMVVTGGAGIGIAACPEPADGSTPQHLAWTALGAVTISLWPIFATAPTPGHHHERRLRSAARLCGSLAVNVTFLALLVWLVVEARHGNRLGLAERVCVAIQTSWPLVIAVTLRRRAARKPSAAFRSDGTQRSRFGADTDPTTGHRPAAVHSISPAS